MNTRIQFLYLTAFSRVGGIEKFNKNIIYCLASLKNRYKITVASLHDTAGDERYSSDLEAIYCAGNKLQLLVHCIRSARATNIVLVGHVNLSPLIFLMKILNRKLQVIVFAHGVEVWRPLTGADSFLMRTAKQILCVSKFTKRMLCEANRDIAEQKMHVFLNAVDPFHYSTTIDLSEVQQIKEALNLMGAQPVLLSIGRISSEDAYKGFDQTIIALKEVKDNGLNPMYLLIGKYEKAEYERLLRICAENDLITNVQFLGFIPDDKLPLYYKVADLFVMPSKGEGFGIVFIEAIRSKMAIIAANTGGTPEALGYGKYGRLVDPDNIEELAIAIREEYLKKKVPRPNDWEEIMDKYGIDRFSHELDNRISELI